MDHEVKPLNTPKPRKKTLKEKYQYVKENFTIEPVLACCIVPVLLARLATQNLNLDKACRLKLKYGDEVCDALVARKGNVYKEEEKAVQALVAAMEGWKTIILTVLPCSMVLFIGAWSDRTGKRKICILTPILGDLLSFVSNLLSTYFFYEIPFELCMFFEAFFPAITGGWITMYMGAFSYISDVSSEEVRTFRVGVAGLCLTAGGPIGTALSGILLEKIGYYGVFSLSSVLCLMSLLYGMYYIKDPKPRLEQVSEVSESPKRFFDPHHVKDTLKATFKQGPNNRRLKAVLVFIALIFIQGPTYGDNTVRYLFCRYRFNWDALNYSYYQTFYIVLHAFGALVSVSIFSRKLRWDDSVLGLISTVSKIAGALATGLAMNSFQMYLAVVVETFNATAFTALRSISSKLCTSDELGKMISLFNLTEITTSMVFGPSYSWIYILTLNFNAGSVYFVSTGITVVPVFIFWWFYKQNKKRIKEQKSMDCESNKDESNQRTSKAEGKEDSDMHCIHLPNKNITNQLKPQENRNQQCN